MSNTSASGGVWIGMGSVQVASLTKHNNRISGAPDMVGRACM